MVKTNRTYNFVTMEPNLLGGMYKNMKVIGILSYQEAKKHRDIYTLHEKMSSVLAQDLNIEDLNFILFEGVNKSKVLIPLEYIVNDSIVEVTSVKIRIEIPNANTEDLAILQEKLTELGFYGCKITEVHNV